MKYQINLLSLKKETLTDRVIYFALNYLRYILVITQIVVIVVFFIKFKVDQDIIDLKESVGQKEEIIAVSKPLTDEAKLLNEKLTEIKTIIGEQDSMSSLMSYILSVFPSDLFLNSFIISGSTTTLAGVSQNAISIRTFLTKLQKDSRFKSVVLKNITKSDDGLHFTFLLTDFKP